MSKSRTYRRRLPVFVFLVVALVGVAVSPLLATGAAAGGSEAQAKTNASAAVGRFHGSLLPLEAWRPAFVNNSLDTPEGTVLPAIVYVNDDWIGIPNGTDPDAGGPATSMGLDAFGTIQGGVTGVAVGGTVNVLAGTYNEAQVLIQKAVTVTGAGAATTTINGGNTGIASAGLVRVDLPMADEGNVTVTGFTVTNPGLTGSSRYHLFGKSQSTLSTVTFSNIKITGVNLADYGIYADRTRGNLVFDHNEITNCAFNPILIERPTGSTDVNNNTITGNASTAYFNFTYGGQDVLTLQRFANNIISGPASAVTVNSSSNIGGGLGKYTNVSITDNTITGLAATRIGINLSNTANAGSETIGAIENPVVTGNVITGTNAATSKGIRLNGYVLNAAITRNTIRNLERGISAEIFMTHFATGTEAHFNHVVGNTSGIVWDGAASGNAENNWWGCNYGPGTGGAGCSETPNAVTGAGAASVDSNPWIVLGIDAASNPIVPGGSSLITADMTHNSTPSVPSMTTFVPTVPVTFLSTQGTLSLPSGPITLGQATATFTSTSASNGTTAVTVDKQTAGTTISVLAPTFSIDNVTMQEGLDSATNYVFTVTKSGETLLSSEVTAQTADNTATAGDNDYVFASMPLTFGPEEGTKTFTVQVNGDSIVEPDESFFVNLSDPVNATIDDGQGVGTITNDDFVPMVLSIANARVNEGTDGKSFMFFTVTATPGAARIGGGAGVTVNYHTSDGTATSSGEDYVPEQNGFLDFGDNFGNGPITRMIRITVSADDIKEPNEFFYVTLDQPTGATIARATAAGVIVDDERAYTADLDRDRKTDFTVFRPSTQTWYTLASGSQNPIYLTFGLSQDRPVPGDYDGDGILDYAVRRPGTTNQWWIQHSSTFGLYLYELGIDSDLSVQADYDGDGKTDVAVFRAGTWSIRRSSDGVVQTVQFGLAGDQPIPGDFDGDGKADQTVFRNGTWYSRRSSNGTMVTQPWGQSGDRPVGGDFDGDGRYDFTVYRNGTWYILESLSGQLRSAFWGVAEDVPVVGDYDGDGTSDVSVFRPSLGTWYVLRSSDNSVVGVAWGLTGDIPIPGAYSPQ